MKHLLWSTVLLTFFGYGLKAQSGIVSTGESSRESSISIGQVFYVFSEDNSGSISPGIQHTYTVSSVTSSKQEGLNIGISAFPNPTSDFLEINTDFEKFTNLQYEVIAGNGSKVNSGTLNKNYRRISLGPLPEGVYYIMFKSEAISETYRVIKN